MHRLTPIEGLRGYLAMLVLIGHMFVFGAYVHLPDYFHHHLGGVLDIIDRGGLFVNCFMIVSGFVIFMLIDQKQEPYRIFILRRFLRIFPVYLVLLALAFPCQELSGAVLPLTRHFQSPQAIEHTQLAYDGLWSHLWVHLLLHLSLLQGLVPSNLLPNSSTAFLGPAWSLSLEWQFYLIAPIWYALFVTKIVWQRLLMYGACLLMILKSHYFLSQIEQGAALPLQIVFFLTGIVSYFTYNALRDFKFRGDVILPIIILIMMGIYRCVNKPLEMVPFMIWGLILGLLLEPHDSFSSRLIGPFFTNRLSLWLGKRSYSIYLSHGLIGAALQYLILRLDPEITQGQLLWTLLTTTLTITLLVSDLLFRTIEAPCIELGKRMTASGENGRA